jgi:hypothetical protein
VTIPAAKTAAHEGFLSISSPLLALANLKVRIARRHVQANAGFSGGF